MLIYVDDIVITRNNDSLIQQLIGVLRLEFAIKDLGRFHYFLGMEVQYLNTCIDLSQRKYAKDLIIKAGLEASSHFNTPMAMKVQQTIKDHTECDAKTYQSLAGALLYPTHTRPDIVHAKHKICQKVQNLMIGYFKAIKRIIRYIKETLNFGLHFTQQSSLNLYGFCDAYWGMCPIRRRSTSSYSVYLGSNCVS